MLKLIQLEKELKTNMCGQKFETLHSNINGFSFASQQNTIVWKYESFPKPITVIGTSMAVSTGPYFM